MSTLAPSVSINEGVTPAQITVSINGKSSTANLPSGGDGWEEIDINSLPTDFSRTDLLRFEFKIVAENSFSLEGNDTRSSFAMFRLSGESTGPMRLYIPLLISGYSGNFEIWYIESMYNFQALNEGDFFMTLYYLKWDGTSWTSGSYHISKSNFSDCIRHFWRKKE